MADSCLHISWTGVVPGREERAVEVFNESVGLYGRLQQEGKIESFNVVPARSQPRHRGLLRAARLAAADGRRAGDGRVPRRAWPTRR